MLNLLLNDCFSVLLVDRTQEKKAFNYNIYNRTALTVAEIESDKCQKTLHYYNQQKAHDVYIKAESGGFYNLVIDDLTAEKARNLMNVLYIDLLINSSTNNYQAIININKQDFTKAEADFLVAYLNQEFGDPNFKGANHYFRYAGFYNKKQKNNNELVELLNVQNSQDKNNQILYFKEILKSNFKDLKNTNIKETNTAQQIAKAELTEAEKKAMRREVMGEIALCRKMFKNLDWSAIDFRIVKRLLKKGYALEKIATALNLFTDYEDRHNDPNDYLIRTLHKAKIAFLAEN